MVDKRDPFFIRAMDATMDFIFGEDDPTEYYEYYEAQTPENEIQKPKPDPDPYRTSSVILEVNGKKSATYTLEPGEYICISIGDVKADSL